MGYATIRRACASLLLYLVVMAQPVKAETIEVVSMVLGDGLQQADHSGFYGELMDEILKGTDAPSRFSVYPFKRALKVFFTGNVDCIWALDAAFLSKFDEGGGDRVESALVLNSQQFLFTMPDKPKIGSLPEVAGKTIGVLNGTNIDASLVAAAANVVKLPSQEAKIDMMLAGRLDAIGGWTPDIYITMKRLGLDSNLITPMFSLDSSGVRIVCHDTPKTDAFLEAINVSIADVLASQAYEDIFARFGVPTNMK